MSDASEATQFRPGGAWQGNAGGRPKGRSVRAKLLQLIEHDDTVLNAISAAILRGIQAGDIAFVKLFIDRTEGRTPPAADPDAADQAVESILFYLPENGRNRAP